MQPVTEPTQAQPALLRTARSAPAAPPCGVPDQFGDVLTQVQLGGQTQDQGVAPLQPSGAPVPALPTAPAPAQAAAPAGPTAPGSAAVPVAEASPSQPEAAAIAKATSSARPGKPAKEVSSTPAAEAKEDKPAAETDKPTEAPQAPVPTQPAPPASPQAALPQAVPTEAVPPAAASAVQQPAALPTGPGDVGDADTSTDEASAPASAAGNETRETPSPLARPAAASVAPSPSAPPNHAAPSSDADDVNIGAVQKHATAVPTEKEPTTAAAATPAEAQPVPPPLPAPPLNALPLPVGIAPHLAPTPAQAPSRPSAAGEPARPPAAQVGPVLASFAAGAAHAGAPQHLTIRLDPMDLGRVQVRIERSPDGSARVELKVEKPDTLLLLLRDQPQLHRALDLAGVPSAERTLQFHLAPPDAPTPGGMAASGSDGGHGGHGQQRPGQQQHGRFAAHGTPFFDDSAPGPAAFRRAGVDITA